MNPERTDGWEQLDMLTDTYNIAVDVFGKLIGSYRVYAVQSGERNQITDARTLVRIFEEGADIQCEEIQ